MDAQQSPLPLRCAPAALLRAGCLAAARAAALAASLACAAASAQEPLQFPSASADTPRAYGYTVGDVVRRRVLLQVPAGLALDPASLPPVRRPGQALELRSARVEGDALLLEYQVFLAPTEVRTLEMPPLRLRFAGPAGEREVRVDAWPLTVAPLVPLDVSPREGLGDLRPDTPPPLIDTAARQRRLLLLAAGLALLAGWLLHVYVGLPWWARGRRPFAQAWRLLRVLPAAASQAQQRDAMLQLHRALDRSAGRVVFAAGLDEFVAAQPRFAPLHGALAGFFRRSQAEFFAADGSAAATTAAGTADAGWLLQLARACRDAERGSA